MLDQPIQDDTLISERNRIESSLASLRTQWRFMQERGGTDPSTARSLQTQMIGLTQRLNQIGSQLAS